MAECWLETLMANEKALNRLKHLLDHTLNDEDTSMFPSVEDAAEVFAIMWMAYTDASFSEWVANTKPDQRLVTVVSLGIAEIDEVRDEFRFTTKGADTPTYMAIATQ